MSFIHRNVLIFIWLKVANPSMEEHQILPGPSLTAHHLDASPTKPSEAVLRLIPASHQELSAISYVWYKLRMILTNNFLLAFRNIKTNIRRKTFRYISWRRGPHWVIQMFVLSGTGSGSL